MVANRAFSSGYRRSTLFRFSSDQDAKDSTQEIAQTDQGGLGLPDRDYYFKDDAKSQDIRKAYLAHVQKMLELLGDKPEAAAAEAQTVMRIETALAQGIYDQGRAPRSAKTLPQDDGAEFANPVAVVCSGRFISLKLGCRRWPA